MKTAIACPSCKRQIRVREGEEGRWLLCPRCQEGVYIPGPEEPPDRPRTRHEPDDPDAEEEQIVFSPSDRLGIAALLLGTVSVMLLCIPFVGLAAFGLSSVGIVLGFTGLYGRGQESRKRFRRPAARRASSKHPFRDYNINYPLAGIVACLLALLLAFLPFLISSNPE
jgi:hypothetical protein